MISSEIKYLINVVSVFLVVVLLYRWHKGKTAVTPLLTHWRSQCVSDGVITVLPLCHQNGACGKGESHLQCYNSFQYLGWCHHVSTAYCWYFIGFQVTSEELSDLHRTRKFYNSQLGALSPCSQWESSTQLFFWGLPKAWFPKPYTVYYLYLNSTPRHGVSLA